MAGKIHMQLAAAKNSRLEMLIAGLPGRVTLHLSIFFFPYSINLFQYGNDQYLFTSTRTAPVPTGNAGLSKVYCSMITELFGRPRALHNKCFPTAIGIHIHCVNCSEDFESRHLFFSQNGAPSSGNSTRESYCTFLTSHQSLNTPLHHQI